MSVAEGDADFAAFMAISVILTGYDGAELGGTGCAPEYWHQFRQVLPGEVLGDFLAPVSGLEGLEPEAQEAEVRRIYLSDVRLGPVARALIQLWYLGQWVPLPEDWRNRFGASRFDVAKIISTRAYKEGLVWDAIGAHPMGAKQQGFGAWAQEPPKRGAVE
ncbi:hypothetical protein ACW9UR_13860 [Halovulum sp. GXIMD14794]